MRVIDLTHPLHTGMPVYPGTEGAAFSPIYTCEKNGFRETLLRLTSHTGTHMDAPAHIFADGKTLDQFPADRFVGPAVVIDCTDVAPGQTISLERILAHPQAGQAEFLLFRTGWDRFWGTDAYFSGYPCLCPETAAYLLAQGKKGVGLDTISLDPVGSLQLHRQVLSGGGTVILENLTGLEALPHGLFTLCALPLRQQAADGSPIRAVALLEASTIF